MADPSCGGRGNPCKQPPDDNGSRSNLKDRKGQIKNVDKAFVGIVNVYQLIPKGAGAIPRADLGVPPPPPGATIYSQEKIKPNSIPNIKMISQGPVKVKGLSKRQIQKNNQLRKEQELMNRPLDYNFVKDTHERSFKLRSTGGGMPDAWIEDVGSYERILKKYPHKIKQYDYDNNREDRKTINKRVHLVMHAKPEDREAVLIKQAMNLGVKIQTMKDWVKLANQRKIERLEKEEQDRREKAAKQAAKQAEMEKETKQISTPNILRPLGLPPARQSKQSSNELPIPVEGLKRISEADSNTPDRYFKLRTISQIQKANTEDNRRNQKLVYIADSENKNIQYFIDLSTQRKRKVSKVNLKRSKPVKRKIIKSYVIKKSILDNLKFSILGRRKYG
jgi:hypothetical protein